ncbi:immunity 53 family protein [Flavobacterium sp. AC]|uniref:Immunity 53 family protein n=1 Tax=Flavobacterium azizsancarii TaxID=2961580 RepID=A0ABT4WCE1_9FLAO|nr:Imm53 family immunity protein [Flavobacterium azizsancarii]MDA6070183.1 immunity 53 family protein [Flavobacterium azizsancarii]
MINWIQNWYTENCDGEWEHHQGIKIETLDNPGWNVEINFNFTNTEVNNENWKVYEFSENDWIGYSIIDNIFNASGDSFKLNVILKIFKLITENKSIDEDIVTKLINENKG